MSSHFQLNARSDGQYTFRLKTGNHEVPLTSQPYGSRQAARRGIEKVPRNSRIATRFVRMIENEGACHFVLVSDVGQTVGTSEIYFTHAALDDGIQSVMIHGATDVIKEPTTHIAQMMPACAAMRSSAAHERFLTEDEPQ